MNPRLLIRICLIGLLVLMVLYVVEKWNSESWQANPGYQFIAIIVLGVIGAILVVTVVLPNLGEAVSTAMYSSGEEVKQDESMKALAKIAAGDYQGAITLYKEMMKEKPQDPFPVSEIGKLYADKLHQPAEAVAFLQQNLEARSWSEDDAAFLMFRMVDVRIKESDFDAAKELLEQISGNFPGTRHGANARHKINEVEQLQFKEMQSRRAKGG